MTRKPPLAHPTASPPLRTHASRPLWRDVPTHSPDGERLVDFMMLIPRLRQRPEADQRAIAARLHDVLAAHPDLVVFADLNLRLNLLWVSLRPRRGATLTLPWAIREAVPEAKLIANRFEVELAARR